MRKIALLILMMALMVGCASVMPVEPTPENFTLVEAEGIVERVLSETAFYERYKITPTELSFINTRVSGVPVRISLKDIVNMVTQRGFSGGQYYSALVTVYYKDKDLNMLKFEAECTSLKEARDFVSALTKLSQFSKKNQAKRIAELERAYKNGILSRKEYLDKKEKMSQKF